MKPDLFLHDLRVALRSLARANVGFAFSRLLGGYIQDVRLPGPLPSFGSVGVILAATVIASVLQAARVDVMEALRSE